MNVSAPFIRRPVMTTLIMLALIIAGLWTFWRLPVSDLPDIEHPRIDVIASYSGASPETMMNSVTKPLEKALGNIGGVHEMSSRTSRGSVSIHLDFNLSKDIDVAAREVQAALIRAESELPSDLTQRPTYHKKEASQEHIAFLLLTSSTESVNALRDYTELYIEPQLARIEGVAAVDLFGAPYGITIQINPDLLASRGITFDQLLSAIKRNNTDLPLGSIQTGSKRLAIELDRRLRSVKDFEELVIADGPIRLKDVAKITDKDEENSEFHYATRDQNELALIIGIQKASGANTVAISQAIQAMLPEINQELPPAMTLQLWFDKAVWIEESIVDVQWSLALAFVLVVGVIYFSLGRISEAIIPSIALPMSLLGTFIAMYCFGFSLDILSLLALTLSIGFVVDDAIVVVENIVRHGAMGKSKLEASLSGSKEICFTVISMTLSLIVVFAPLLFMDGMHGRLLREFSVTLAVAILVSGFISLTLTPMLCSRWLPEHGETTSLQRKTAEINAKLAGWYGVTLKYCLKAPKTVFAVSLIGLGLTLPFFNKLPVDLFPKEDRGFIFSIVNLSPGITPAKTRKYQAEIEQIMQKHPAVESFIDLNQESTQIFAARLLPADKRAPQADVINEIQEAIDAIPGTQAFTVAWQLINVDLDMAQGGNLKFMLRGSNARELKDAGDRLLSRLQKDSNFTFARLDADQDVPKLAVKVNEIEAWRHGLSTYDVQAPLQQLFSGGTVTHIEKNGQRYDVKMELDKSFGRSINALDHIHLSAGDNKSIPYTAVAKWEEQMGSPSIGRVDQVQTLGINFALNKEISTSDGLELIQKHADEVLSGTVKGRLRGTAALVSGAAQQTLFLLLASALAMYIILGMLYESFLHPLTILSSLPFAGVGGVLTLLLFDEPLSIYSIVGFILLIGIVKKNGIMIVDFALQLRKENVSSEEAIYESSLVRFRPIMMTTIAAIMGAIPIAIGIGDGSNARRGLGLVIVGGLLFSQFLILYVTPVIYLLLEKGVEKVRSMAQKKPKDHEMATGKN